MEYHGGKRLYGIDARGKVFLNRHVRCPRLAVRQFLAKDPELQSVSELQFYERADEQSGRGPPGLGRGSRRVCVGRVKGDQKASIAIRSQYRALSFRSSSAPLTSSR